MRTGKIVLPSIFEPNDEFPEISKNLALRDNGTFGKHLIANHDIEKGQEIMVCKPFASIFMVSLEGKCFECGKDKIAKRFDCKHCKDVHFCSKKCSQSQCHKEYCDKTFDKSDCRLVRIVTKIVKNAINLFNDNIDRMVEFCSIVIDKKEDISSYSQGERQYGELLSLSTYSLANVDTISDRVFKIVEKFPQLKRKQNHMAMIMRLIRLHCEMIGINAFHEDYEIDGDRNLHCEYIFTILSRINHSCVPNVDNYLDNENLMHCQTNSRIKKWEQIFISYIFDPSEFQSKEERKQYIRESWHFDCKCPICIE